MMNRKLAACAALAALAGCTTHLEVQHASPADPASRRGIAYFLPFTQFATKVTWTVTGCGPAIEIAEKVETTPLTAPDPAHLYTIDYASLSAFTKTSSVKVDFYDSGSIKSINATADDRTGEILTKTLSAVGKVAGLAFGGDNGTKVSATCSKAVSDAIEKLGKQNKEVKRLTAKLAEQTRALDALTVRILRSGSAVPQRVLTDHDRRISDVVATKLELDAATAVQADLRKPLSYTEAFLYPKTSAQTAAYKAVLPKSVLEKWVGNLASFSAGGTVSETALDQLFEGRRVFVELENSEGWATGQDYAADKTGSASARAGLRYRVGIPGFLAACADAACSDTVGTPKEIERFPVRILQRGTTFYLPFKSAPFSNGGLTATFAENGTLTSAGYEQKRAPAEIVAQLGDLLADQGVTLGGKIQASKTTELEDVNTQVALAKARKELADAQAALVRSPNGSLIDDATALAADTAAKNAEIANLAADMALRKARAEHDAAVAGQ